MQRWHGKHPQPWDFFYTFDNVSGRKLDWFWRDWYFTNGYIDLAVGGVRKTGSGYAVDIRNIGGFDAPVNLVLEYTDGSTQTVHETPAIWQADQSRTTVNLRTRKTLRVPDAGRRHLDGCGSGGQRVERRVPVKARCPGARERESVERENVKRGAWRTRPHVPRSTFPR